MNEGGSLFVGFLIIAGFIFFIYHSNKKEDQDINIYQTRIRTSIVGKSKKVIEKHRKQLAIERKKYVYFDAYGNENLSRWKQKEIPYFIEHYLFPILTHEEIRTFHFASDIIFERIETVSKNQIIDNKEFKEDMNGFEFETYCLEKLTEIGWKVTKTKNGADQGVDLIAKKGKRNIAIQCKKYSRPVGNKAVQEVKSGLEFYALNEGVVISNRDYTKSAKQLAGANNIKLLHYMEIDKM
ncbi:restriction endonuclease [Kaistella sp.]|uniref:restriction endonuclease n=1 Tax=Kaistella sp. TaxID=2782235 RepID=UPI00359F1459